MPYTAAELAVIALVMTFGSVIQGCVGFASGLLGVPLLVLYGLPLPDATVINFVSTSVQNLAGARQLSSHLKARDVFWPTVFRSVGLPLGIAALGAAGAISQDRVQQIIGGILLVSIVLLTGLRVHPREHLHLAWIAVLFLASGFLMGFASIGGAPMVFYVNALTWSAPKSRGFLFLCSSLLMPLMGVLLVWKFGADIARPALAALIVMPPGIAGLVLGLKLGHRLDKDRFRRLTYALLVMIALAAILSPMVVKPNSPAPAASSSSTRTSNAWPNARWRLKSLPASRESWRPDR
jgi:uncharacterized membrane protein YfcA